MTKRYELSDAEWEIVADLFTAHQRPGRSRIDDRLMLNGVLWVLYSGVTLRDMPERFGLWSTVNQRFRDWRNQGTSNKMLKWLHLKLNAQGQIDLTTWCIDSTAVRATRASAGAGKKRGAEESTYHALGRSRGGLTTKIHMVSDAHGIPLHFTLSGGNASDISHAQRLLDGVHIPSKIEVGHASAAASSWPTKAMTQNPCGNTATAIGCIR